MMKPKIVAAAGLLAMVLGGCTVQGRAYQPQPVPPSVSMIHIYRPYHYYGSLVVPRVTCAQQSASLKPGGYYSYYANSGPVTCSASTEATSELKFDAKPGEQYFVREEIVPGNIVGRAHFTLVNPDTAREEIAKCHEQQPAPDSDARR